MPKISVIINIVNGKLEDRKPLADLFSDLKDGRYYVELSTAKKRTNPQNRYYHGLVVPMIRKGMQDMGNDVTVEEVHEFLKARFNSVPMVNPSSGEVMDLPKSTARLSTVQFNEFIQKIQLFAAEFLGMDIPSPNEQLEFKL